MASYDIRPLQLRILDILLALDKVCKEHNLRYYLWAGTMLGAVRHKGFIPWDDDADVAMPREDYNTLVEHSKEWLPAPYELNSIEKDNKFTGTYAKLVDASTTIIERYDFMSVGGIYVDVFPIDGVPSSKLKGKIHVGRYSFLKKMAYFCNRNPYKHGKGASSWIPRLVQHFYTNETIQKTACDIMKEYPYAKAEKVCDYDDGTPGIMPKSYIGEPVPIEFEGKMLMGVALPDKYLSHKYGDYMTIPPGEKQRQHNFYYLDYELPYKDYTDDRAFMKS